MTAPHRPPADLTDDPDRTAPPARRPLLDLSLTQLIGGALAAATGAALASRLGVAGTILGAAAVSLISAVGGAAYTNSLRRTRDRVRAVAGRPGSPAFPPVPPPRRGVRRRPAPAPSPDPVRRPLVRTVLVGAAAVLVVAFAAITGYELLTGAPISGAAGRTTLSALADEASDPTGPPSRGTTPAETSGTGSTAPTTVPTPTEAPTTTSPPPTTDPPATSAPPTSGPPTSDPPTPPPATTTP